MQPTGGESLGRQLYALRALLDLGQEDAARAAGVTPAMISYIESGRRKPPPRLVAALLRCYARHFGWLTTKDLDALLSAALAARVSPDAAASLHRVIEGQS